MILYLSYALLGVISFFVGYYLAPASKPCIKQISSSLSKSVQTNDKDCKYGKVYDHCSRNYNEDKTYLHLYQGHVPPLLWPNLHHPATPAKSVYIMTGSKEWSETSSSLHDNCDKIYLTRTGQRANQPNKCVAVVRVPEGVSSPVQISHRLGKTAGKTNQYMEDFSMIHCYQEEILLLAPMLQQLDSVKRSFLRLMGPPTSTTTSTTATGKQEGADSKRRTVTILVANDGVMDLLLNFLCSAEMAKIDFSNIVVFVGQEASVQLVTSMGVKAVYNPAMGSMPKLAAGAYMDKTFGRMMWFKVTSVYIALTAGYDVLFQVRSSLSFPSLLLLIHLYYTHIYMLLYTISLIIMTYHTSYIIHISYIIRVSRMWT